VIPKALPTDSNQQDFGLLTYQCYSPNLLISHRSPNPESDPTRDAEQLTARNNTNSHATVNRLIVAKSPATRGPG
jgi:hypothetical protein